jgi:hypothetical protein
MQLEITYFNGTKSPQGEIKQISAINESGAIQFMRPDNSVGFIYPATGLIKKIEISFDKAGAAC